MKTNSEIYEIQQGSEQSYPRTRKKQERTRTEPEQNLNRTEQNRTWNGAQRTGDFYVNNYYK